MCDFDVAPASALLGDDLSDPVRNNLDVRQQILFLHLLVLHGDSADAEPDMRVAYGRLDGIGECRLASDNEIQASPVHHDFHFRLWVHARDFFDPPQDSLLIKRVHARQIEDDFVRLRRLRPGYDGTETEDEADKQQLPFHGGSSPADNATHWYDWLMSFLKPLLKEPQTAFKLVNRRNGHILATHVFTAFDSKSRRQGLLGRDGFHPGHALIIAPTNAIHTWFMRFPIDVAFITRDGRVVKVRHQLRPWRMSAALRGYAVIELPAGTLAAADTVAQDTLSLEL
jgi:uncharacterized membrane protein (UPF0127 family)